MDSPFKRILRRIPMLFLAVFVGLAVGFGVWKVIDPLQSQAWRDLFDEQLRSEVEQRVRANPWSASSVSSTDSRRRRSCWAWTLTSPPTSTGIPGPWIWTKARCAAPTRCLPGSGAFRDWAADARVQRVLLF